MAAALTDCRGRGGGDDCRVIATTDRPGYGALYEACAGEHCRIRAVAGRQTRDQAHRDARQDCRDFHGAADCLPLADWEEFGIAAPDAASAASPQLPPAGGGTSMDSARIAQAARQGNAHAEYILGKLAYHRSDYEQASYWLKRSADKGSDQAKAALGILYLYGRGVARDPDQGRALLRQTVPGEDPALAELADISAGGQPSSAALEPDPLLRQKYAPLEESAFRGIASAQAALGFYYQEGRNALHQDTQRALFWLGQAASRGEPMAQYHLGMGMFHGTSGFFLDRSRGFELIKRSANQGFAPAQTFMGILMEARKHPGHAESYFRKAAAQGEPVAVRRLREAGWAKPVSPPDGGGTEPLP